MTSHKSSLSDFTVVISHFYWHEPDQKLGVITRDGSVS